jgi:hypothetical protein
MLRRGEFVGAWEGRSGREISGEGIDVDAMVVFYESW